MRRGMSILVLPCRRHAHFGDLRVAKPSSLDPPPLPFLASISDVFSYIFLYCFRLWFCSNFGEISGVIFGDIFSLILEVLWKRRNVEIMHGVQARRSNQRRGVRKNRRKTSQKTKKKEHRKQTQIISEI